MSAVHPHYNDPFALLKSFSLRCYRSAYTYLEKYTELDPNGRPSGGAEHYREALRQVNAGNNRC